MSDEARMRLDVYLWRTRFFKTRTSASDAIIARGARIERNELVRRVEKPSALVATGDLISFAAPSGPRLIRILQLPERRGPAAEAAVCYEDMTITHPDRQSDDHA